MAKQLFANNGKGKLNAGITNIATALTLQAGQGALFPTITGADWFMVTLIDSAGQIEVIKVTSHAAASDSLAVVQRGQEGTTARAYSINDKAEMRWTKGSAEWFRDNLMATAGTRMSFQQTAAPTLWTKEASAAFNDAALRFTTGAAGTGGADAFSAFFGAGKLVGGTTLTQAQTPVKGHAHVVNDPGHPHTEAGNTLSSDLSGGEANFNPINNPTPNLFRIAAYPERADSVNNTTTGNTTIPAVTGITLGNGADATATPHDHTLQNSNMKFIDCIVAAKD